MKERKKSQKAVQSVTQQHREDMRVPSATKVQPSTRRQRTAGYIRQRFMCFAPRHSLLAGRLIIPQRLPTQHSSHLASARTCQIQPFGARIPQPGGMGEHRPKNTRRPERRSWPCTCNQARTLDRRNINNTLYCMCRLHIVPSAVRHAAPSSLRYAARLHEGSVVSL